ncbi:MAG: cation diffusion facilitator family transporter [Phyllobacterium sp.]
MTRSIWVTIGIGVFGVLFGLLSGSLSIVFDGVFSTIDAAMSMLALFVAKLLTSEGTRRFQHGFWHIEPMVLAFNGGILMLLCFYAFLNAIGTLLEGGRELSFDWAIGYSITVFLICVGMLWYEQRMNRRIGSEFIKLDLQSWLMSALITLALLIAFGAAWLMEGTRFDDWTPYVDPAVLAILSLCLIPVPIKTVRKAFREILLVTPSAMDRQVRKIMDELVKSHGFKTYSSYVMKVGRARFIEIHVVLPEDYRLENVASLDAIRQTISDEIGGAGPQRWLTVSFTGDESWI